MDFKFRSRMEEVTMFYFKVLFIYSCEKSENNYPTSQKGSRLLNFKVAFSNLLSQGSSVSIVCGYGPHDRAIKVRSPAEAKGFFL
jgi:hypothetical protein